MVLQGGTAVVNVVANGAALASSISGAVTGTVSKLGRSLQSSGLAMTKFLTVPLAALGAVSTSMALDFETTFARINALAGDIGHTTDEAKGFVLKLAQATGQDPGGLAEAMYFAASAGLKAKSVFPVVRASAQAAATGMADAATNAKLLTTVLHDYEGTGLSAANAMNILTRAIKVGKAEPADFAENIGIVIPLASQLGVSFQDVAAAIAQATNAGVESSRAVTGLRFLLASLQNPTEESKKAFEKFGFSIADIQKQLTEPGGLLKVMQDIATTFDLTSVAGKEAWGTITGGARGAVVANTLVGNSAESARVLWDKLGQSALDSADDFQKAFNLMKQTPAFKFQQALTALKEAAIELGTILIPILRRDVIPVIRDVIDWFQNLSQHTRGLIVRIGLVAAAFGPLLVVLGSVIRLGAGVVTGLINIGNAAGKAANNIKTTGTAAEGAATGFLDWAGPLAGIAIAMKEANDQWTRFQAGDKEGFVRGIADAFNLWTGSAVDLGGAVGTSLQVSEEGIKNWADQVALGTITLNSLRDKLIATGASSDDVAGILDKVKEALDGATPGSEFKRNFDAATDALKFFGGHLDKSEKAMLRNAAAQNDMASALAILKNAIDRASSPLKNLADQHHKAAEAADDQAQHVKALQTKIEDLPKHTTLKIDTKADTSGITALVANMVGAGFHLAGSDWEAHGTVIIHTKAGSPWPWEVIEAGLTGVGFQKGNGGGGGGGGDADAAFFMKTIIEVHTNFSQIKARLETLLPLIRDVAGVGAADQAHAYARELNQLEKSFERLKTKALDFRDAVKGAFTDSANLVGVIGDKLSEFRDQQQSFLEAQAAGTLEPGQVAPAAPDLSGLIAAQVAQARQLADLLKKLQTKGLNVANLSDLASQGAGAIPIATALLDNPELIQQLNQAQQDIADITQTTADKMTQAAFGDKLLAMSHSLDDLLDHLNHFLDGLHPEKINDKNREFVDALDHLIQAIENATGRMGAGGGGGGGGAPNVTVNVGPGTDAAGAGRAVRDALLQLQRRNVTTGL